MIFPGFPRGGVCLGGGNRVCLSAYWDTESQTDVKTLPFCNYVADGNNLNDFDECTVFVKGIFLAVVRFQFPFGIR